MSTRDGATTGRVVRDVMRECAARGRDVTEPLVAFTMKALLDLGADQTPTPQDLQTTKELCVEKLTADCSPSLDTIRMQLCFEQSSDSRRELLVEIRQKRESQLLPVRKEITEGRAGAREGLDVLYGNIVTFTLLSSGLGSPCDSDVLHEATAALRSIFPPTAVGTFMVLTKTEKEQQLRELAEIVTGVCLYNKADKKGGEELGPPALAPGDLPDVLLVAEDLEEHLSASRRLAWKYTAVLEKLGAGAETRLRDALYNVRQHEAFLRILQADAAVCARRVGSLQNQLWSQVKQLREAVGSRTAVHATRVFPVFRAVSRMWSELLDGTTQLGALRDAALCLHPFLASQAQLFPEAWLDGLLEGQEVKTDWQRIRDSSDQRVDPAEMELQEWLLPDGEDELAGLQLEFDGVCGHTLVRGGGLLLPGNPSVGILKHRRKFYAFSSRDAALEFASCPDDFIAAVAEKTRCSPELLRLLRLRVPSESSQFEHQGGGLPGKCSSGTQTDLHPLETNIVKNYEWNEWEMRRQAIKLANLRTKATHSTQTNLSHMRRENVTQTWVPKVAGCQTKREGESNVPRPRVFLAGLRGQKAGRVVKTNLTRSVDE